MLATGEDVYVSCWYSDDVIIYDGMDMSKGRRILDYNSAEGKSFAEFNKINYKDKDYDYKAKYRGMLALPELAAEYHPVVKQEPEPVKQEPEPEVKPAVTLDRTNLPTYSTRSKSKKQNSRKKRIPSDRMPNYAEVYGIDDSDLSDDSGDKQIQQPTSADTPSPERAAAGTPPGQSADEQQTDGRSQPAAAFGQAVPADNQMPDGIDKSGQPVRIADKSKVRDTVSISEVLVGDMIMDATLDALYRQKYVFDTDRIAELNVFRDNLDNAILSELQSQFHSYGVNFITDLASVTDKNTRLLFEVMKYRAGEFNLVKNISTKITIKFRIVNPYYNADTTFKGDFSCEASAYYPNEKARLAEISRKVTEYLKMMLSLIRVKDVNTVRRVSVSDQSDDADAKEMPLSDDEKIVPVNETTHKKGLRSAGRDM